MPLLRFATALLLFITGAAANTTEVGSTTITVPAPPGFVQVTPQMKELWQLVQAGQGDNRILALFIPEDQQKNALEGRTVTLDRTVNVQTRRRFEAATITPETFEKVKTQVLAMLVSRQVDAVQAKELERFSSNIDKATGTNPMLKQLENASLPPHVNRPDRFSYSEISTMQSSTPGGGQERKRITTTVLAILVKGKLLYCYVGGGQRDLEWTRRATSDWADALQAANRN